MNTYTQWDEDGREPILKIWRDIKSRETTATEESAPEESSEESTEHLVN